MKVWEDKPLEEVIVMIKTYQNVREAEWGGLMEG